MIKIGILGYSGRMGQAIAREIDGQKNCALVAGLARDPSRVLSLREQVCVTSDVQKVIGLSDVVIDFTLPETTQEFATLSASAGKPFLSGVTGLDDGALKAFAEASLSIPILHAPNTSISFAVTKSISALAAKLLAPFKYDVAILDEHHAQKRDAPSGSAKVLGDVITEANGGKASMSFAAVRLGSIIGEHEVIFAGDGEIVRIHHSVADRGIFAKGALAAALWLHGKKVGLYKMEDMLGL